jgi:hypothetical protein
MLLLAGSSVACAGSKKTLSDQAQWTARIDRAIAELQTRLEQCDRRGIVSLLAPPLSEDQTFARNLDALCERASAIRPELTVERLWLKPADTVRADVQWTLRANLAPPAGSPSPTPGRQGGTSAMVMGTAHFTLTGKESPRLTAIDGDNPFTPQFDQTLLP